MCWWLWCVSAGREGAPWSSQTGGTRPPPVWSSATWQQGTVVSISVTPVPATLNMSTFMSLIQVIFISKELPEVQMSVLMRQGTKSVFAVCNKNQFSKGNFVWFYGSHFAGSRGERRIKWWWNVTVNTFLPFFHYYLLMAVTRLVLTITQIF